MNTLLHNMKEFLAKAPFDLYGLYLFHLVVKHRSFTKAAGVAGVTQSAITRQMQNMENGLGVDLLNRTTRSVAVTEAGMLFCRESARLVGDVEALLQRMREEHGEAKPEIRLGVSRTVGLACLPGFLHAYLRRSTGTKCRVAQWNAVEIMQALEAHELDVGIITQPSRLYKTLRAVHGFTDAFALVVPAQMNLEKVNLNQRRPRASWALGQSWILPDEDSNTGRQLRRWMKANGWPVEPAMEADNFELMISLISLGMGVGFVPIRSLAAFGRKQTLQRVVLKNRFERNLEVVVRKHRTLPAHLQQFVDAILF